MNNSSKKNIDDWNKHELLVLWTCDKETFKNPAYQLIVTLTTKSSISVDTQIN